MLDNNLAGNVRQVHKGVQVHGFESRRVQYNFLYGNELEPTVLSGGSAETVELNAKVLSAAACTLPLYQCLHEIECRHYPYAVAVYVVFLSGGGDMIRLRIGLNAKRALKNWPAEFLPNALLDKDNDAKPSAQRKH